MPAPKAFVPYNSTDGRFSCDCPKGWEATGGGKPDKPISWAKFTAGNAEIRVDTDFAGSLFGDMAKAGSAMSGDSEPPAAKVHPLGRASHEGRVQQLPGARGQELPIQGIWRGTKVHFHRRRVVRQQDLRVPPTLLSGDRRITIITTCPATNWQALKPAFDTVIASLRHAGG